MHDLVFGPAPGCSHCGRGSGTYQAHKEWCRAAYEAQQAESARDRERGRQLLSAIALGHEERIGRILRGQDSTPPPRIPEPRVKTQDEVLGPFASILRDAGANARAPIEEEP